MPVSWAMWLPPGLLHVIYLLPTRQPQRDQEEREAAKYSFGEDMEPTALPTILVLLTFLALILCPASAQGAQEPSVVCGGEYIPGVMLPLPKGAGTRQPFYPVIPGLGQPKVPGSLSRRMRTCRQLPWMLCPQLRICLCCVFPSASPPL